MPSYRSALLLWRWTLRTNQDNNSGRLKGSNIFWQFNTTFIFLNFMANPINISAHTLWLRLRFLGPLEKHPASNCRIYSLGPLSALIWIQWAWNKPKTQFGRIYITWSCFGSRGKVGSSCFVLRPNHPSLQLEPRLPLLHRHCSVWIKLLVQPLIYLSVTQMSSPSKKTSPKKTAAKKKALPSSHPSFIIMISVRTSSLLCNPLHTHNGTSMMLSEGHIAAFNAYPTSSSTVLNVVPHNLSSMPIWPLLLTFTPSHRPARFTKSISSL